MTKHQETASADTHKAWIVPLLVSLVLFAVAGYLGSRISSGGPVERYSDIALVACVTLIGIICVLAGLNSPQSVIYENDGLRVETLLSETFFKLEEARSILCHYSHKSRMLIIQFRRLGGYAVVRHPSAPFFGVLAWLRARQLISEFQAQCLSGKADTREANAACDSTGVSQASMLFFPIPDEKRQTLMTKQGMDQMPYIIFAPMVVAIPLFGFALVEATAWISVVLGLAIGVTMVGGIIGGLLRLSLARRRLKGETVGVWYDGGNLSWCDGFEKISLSVDAIRSIGIRYPRTGTLGWTTVRWKRLAVRHLFISEEEAWQLAETLVTDHPGFEEHLTFSVSVKPSAKN